jgi:glycosyltransferase involved in cell wall biosynthesis
MKLSVAMCTYNGARFLPAQLQSIAVQTRPPDELVVCDDHSTDATCALLDGFAASAPFPVRRHVNARNLGSTKNFEQAIGLCAGDVIALSDQDDVWHPDKLRRSEAALAAAPAAGLVFTNAEVVDQHMRPLGVCLWECVRLTPRKQYLVCRGHGFGELLEGNFVTGATLAFRAVYKDLILPIPADIRLIHDGWIACLIAATADLVLIDEPLVRYRQHGRQQIGTMLPSVIPESSGLAALREGAHRRTDFDAAIRELGAIKVRLEERVGAYRDRDVIPALVARLGHLETRARLPRSRLSRVPYVLRELFSWRYHAYSKGLGSAAKDLLC